MMRKVLGWICIVSAVLLFVFAAAAYGPRLLDYKKGNDLYRDLARQYTVPNNSDEDMPETETEEFRAEHLKDDADGLKKFNLDEFSKLLREIGVNVKGNEKDYLPISVDSDALLKENADYIGWIYIPKTSISYPVVKSRDNADYIHINFKKQYNYPGTIFMDCRDKGLADSHHVILYGHNMRDGSMFAQIRNYMDQKFADEHPIFWFILPDGAKLYRVFACCEPSPYDDVQYGIDGNEYQNTDDFFDAIKQMISSSLIQTNAEIPDGKDYVMSLSTCVGDSSRRCIVHGVYEGKTGDDGNRLGRRRLEK